MNHVNKKVSDLIKEAADEGYVMTITYTPIPKVTVTSWPVTIVFEEFGPEQTKAEGEAFKTTKQNERSN